MSAPSECGAGGGPVGGGSTATVPSAHPAVAAKITHVKSDGGGGISIAGTPILSGGTIKVAAANPVQQTSLGGTPIALNAGQATTAASIRAIGAGGQSTQVRVVMPMIKQLENVTATGRTQITAIPAAPARSGANASITVTRPVTQATYLPRASVTATQMGGVGVGVGQRLVTPLRATSSATVTPTAPTVLSSTGGFVRGATASVSRSGVALSSQPSSAVISSSNSGAWMQSQGQVQLIRTIHQPRQRIITTSAGVSNANVVTTTPVQAPTALSVSAGQPLATQQTTGPGGGPQAYVATVLPQRQHQATLVYSSNVSAPNASQNPGQQFNPRFAVATPTGGVTTTTPGGTTVTPRQVRPIPLGKSFPTAKLNTTSISIRAPSIPQLNTSVTASPTAVSVSGGATVAPGRGPGAGGTALTATNLSTTRIIQLQQPATGTTQQIIGSGARLAGNVMLQPFLMSTTAAAKMGIRPPVTMTAKVQPSLTITQLNPIGKLSAGGGSGGPTMAPQGVASIQAVPVPNVSASVVNPSSVTGATSAAGGATVLPLTISGRGAGVGPGGNILTGTLTPIKNASGITLGKMMMAPASSAPGADASSTSGATVTGFQRTWNPVVASQSQLMKMYSSHQSIQQNLGHSSLGARSGSSAFVDMQAPTPQQQQPQQVPQFVGSTQMQQGTRMNGTGNSSSSSYDCSSRKKARRSTNDSQHSTQSQASLSLPPPSSEPTPPAGASYMQKHNNGGLLVTAATPGVAPNSAPGDANHRNSTPAVAGNKENANPVDFVIRRPRNCALLNTYKPTHKLANNHFHRYTDVKPREERRATVIDLANQPNVQGKINGWKIYHLRSQMEDLNESEVFSLGRLETMLQDLEKDKEKHSEIERVTELLKGNIQRSKIITDGINEAQNQLMKIFEHKAHVSDIITRCASKRNFKKREKI
ncbi:GM25373 [Drosophila sechellia]|uniref:GM25373 n=1 Tax=Drosophila sechellia TaxID=7238 RepID=B4HG66_DROSE|nr:GM25373 [Drosophila sechellia]